MITARIWKWSVLGDAFHIARKIGFFEWFYKVPTLTSIFCGVGRLRRSGAPAADLNAQTLLEMADCDVGVVLRSFSFSSFLTI